MNERKYFLPAVRPLIHSAIKWNGLDVKCWRFEMQIKVNFEAAIWLLDLFLVFPSIYAAIVLLLLFTINKRKSKKYWICGFLPKAYTSKHHSNAALIHEHFHSHSIYIWIVKSALMGGFSSLLLLYLYFELSSAIEKHNLFFIYNFCVFSSLFAQHEWKANSICKHRSRAMRLTWDVRRLNGNRTLVHRSPHRQNERERNENKSIWINEWKCSSFL